MPGTMLLYNLNNIADVKYYRKTCFIDEKTWTWKGQLYCPKLLIGKLGHKSSADQLQYIIFLTTLLQKYNLAQ